MKCLIVLVVVFVAAAYAATDDDALVEKLLKRYEEQQERKRTLQEECQVKIDTIFEGFINAEDEAGYENQDLSSMVTACVASGSTDNASARLSHCIQTDVDAISKRRSMSAREFGNCAFAAPHFNAVIDGDAASEAKCEQICDREGSVHLTIVHFADCVTNSNIVV